jgi:hypothetical protein
MKFIQCFINFFLAFSSVDTPTYTSRQAWLELLRFCENRLCFTEVHLFMYAVNSKSVQQQNVISRAFMFHWVVLWTV